MLERGLLRHQNEMKVGQLLPNSRCSLFYLESQGRILGSSLSTTPFQIQHNNEIPTLTAAPVVMGSIA